MTANNQCDSCEALMINGVYCHESGCPNMWKTTSVDCRECGCGFYPKHEGQKLCHDCYW